MFVSIDQHRPNWYHSNVPNQQQAMKNCSMIKQRVQCDYWWVWLLTNRDWNWRLFVSSCSLFRWCWLTIIMRGQERCCMLQGGTGWWWCCWWWWFCDVIALFSLCSSYLHCSSQFPFSYLHCHLELALQLGPYGTYGEALAGDTNTTKTMLTVAIQSAYSDTIDKLISSFL